MLSRFNPVIIERQETLPNNHHAVLRFRSTVVGDTLGIPFKKVNMIKDTTHWRNPVADSMAYSYKNNRHYRSDRSVTQGLKIEERYIAPPNLIGQMAEGLDIRYGISFDAGSDFADDVVVSTMPMPALAKLLGYDALPPFEYAVGSVITARVRNCDAYASLLVPNPIYPFSRISITGDELIVECPLHTPETLELYGDLAELAAGLMGVNGSGINNHIYDVAAPVLMPFNKILSIDDDARKQFIWWATDQHRVFSLGRFATWRPGLLLDDLVKDIRLIGQWADRRSRYDVAKHRS
jgi:hypothetical protein